MRQRKIALLGSAPSSVMLAPFGAPDWEVWACSPGAYGAAHDKNVDKWFELHRWEPGQTWMSEGYCDFLREFPGDVYLATQIDEVRNGKVLPVDDLINKYGPYFFTSSLAWMMAMAIEEGATSIGLWGVDMSATEEYSLQKPGLWYFAMLAQSMGIEVGVPPESDLFRPPALYGVSEVTHDHIKLLARQREFDARIADAQRRLQEAEAELTFIKGAKDDLKWVQQTFSGQAEHRSYVSPANPSVLQGMFGSIEVSDQPEKPSLISVLEPKTA